MINDDSITNTKKTKINKKCNQKNGLVSCVLCHVSCVMCHMSYVTCHLSPVTGHLSKLPTTIHSHSPQWAVSKNPKMLKKHKKFKLIKFKENLWYANISEESLALWSQVHWETSYPGRDIPTYTQTDIATSRLNRPRG